jgi:hypothetical protein
MKKKEKWEKPKLIVLVRSRPEEAVLQACKTGGSATPWGADNTFFRCTQKVTMYDCSAGCSDTTPT